ncbi:ArsR family transcriptional regulator [Labilibaculum sp. K2S]|uniref:GbsR/MarR family transcriptional regulator n=1 Tax=Labilibaculum sp. K2S TaxID=3056386 RepID=UPI0025A32D66|nr:ArsR family transcriptional regulator [Labilibaculum sp. K2S]MDM8161604.1 ArsR family transcriptional regulator [Labilibaculum sp. K2S]
MELEKQKKLLVESFGLFMEKQEKLTPIAARIFATLLIDKENGLTFEELVLFLEASKSTISTNLKTLRNAEMISYHTKPGDRKKYFTLSPVGFLARIRENLKMYKTEQELLKEVRDYKVLVNKNFKEDKYTIDHDTPYLDFLTNTISQLEQLHSNIESKCSLLSVKNT